MGVLQRVAIAPHFLHDWNPDPAVPLIRAREEIITINFITDKWGLTHCRKIRYNQYENDRGRRKGRRGRGGAVSQGWREGRQAGKEVGKQGEGGSQPGMEEREAGR